MKKFSKILSVALLVALVLSLGITSAFAETTYGDADGNNSGTAAANTGSVTVANAIDGMEYELYQILTLESFNDAKDAFSYKATAKWSSFINSSAINGVYVTVNNDGYVQWITTKIDEDGETVVNKDQTELEAEAAAFAKLAIAYAEDANNGITKDRSTTAAEGVATFNNLPLGYYLVNSSAGALCSLDTTHLAVNIKEKNEVPSDDKKVEEDSVSQYQDQNDADIGQEINFKTTIHAKKGAQGYVLYDKMEDGLDFVQNSIVITAGNTTLTENTHYRVTSGAYKKLGTDGTIVDDGNATFIITFEQSYLDTINSDVDIVVSYKGKLNADAIVGHGYTNDTTLKYGDNNITVEDETKSYTWGIDIIKQDGRDNTKKLEGAKFVIYKAGTTEGTVQVAKFDSKGKFTGWCAEIKKAEADLLAMKVADFDSASILTTAATTGEIKVSGLDEGVYKLLEVEAPVGYNKLSSVVDATIDSTSDTETGKQLATPLTAETDGFKVVTVDNNAGSVLPSTGGIGTTIFYVVGGVLVLAAIILLVTKKRMSE